MATNGFDMSELDEFSHDLMGLAHDLDKGRQAKKFLRKEGTKLNRENKKQAKSSGIRKKKGNFMKGFKKGKVYKYQGKDLSIRAYNKAPHAHLLNNGHRIVDKNGNEHGFKEGKHFMEKAQENFQDEFVEDVEEFIDDLIDNHGL